MNFKVCSFNNNLLILIEAARHFSFTNNTVNRISFRQTFDVYPNFIQSIAVELANVLKDYRVVAILYSVESIKMNNFPNGVKQTVTYYVYYTTMDDCLIDNVFYDELLTHLTQNLKMSMYVAQVFLQALRHGFNKPDKRIDAIVSEYNLQTHHDDLSEIRRLVLNLNVKQKMQIETLVAKNATFNAILPNMLLLNVTNCIQQESLSIKHSDGKEDGDSDHMPISSYDCDDEEIQIENTIIDDNDAASKDLSSGGIIECEQNYKTYVPSTEFHQHYYYCSYGRVLIVTTVLQISTFNRLIMKNLIAAFRVISTIVDEVHVHLYIDQSKYDIFSKIRINCEILQFKIIENDYIIDFNQFPINYNIDMSVPLLYGTAPLVIANTKLLKDAFKTKVKVIQLYLVVCEKKLHRIMTERVCICKILRILTSPYNNVILYHTLVHIHETDTDFLYKYLPSIGLDGTPCNCIENHDANLLVVPHSQKLWQMRPCIELVFHTHFDWTILKIHSDFMRRTTVTDIFGLYDVFESGNLKIAHLLETKIFKCAIENMTTFKFYNETGQLYPFHTSGYEELYIYTLIKMTRIVYRCIVMPLMKLDNLSAKNLLPSRYVLTYAFIDDPLTPTTSVRGPQSTRNLKSIETSDKMFDTKVINVTMLMNSFNLCGSESSENTIRI